MMLVSNCTTLSLPAPGWGMQLANWLVPPLAPNHPLANLDIAPVRVTYPTYFPHRPSVVPWLSDRWLSLVAPVVAYWYMALGYLFLDWVRWPFFERYRMRDPTEAEVRNRVSLGTVTKAVVWQQVVQTAVGIFSVESDEVGYEQVFRDHQAYIRAVGVIETRIVTRVLGTTLARYFLRFAGTFVAQVMYWWIVPSLHILYAFFFLDTYQYFAHRLFHENRFLYRKIHSYHHKLIVTHAVGAIYNHPVEGFAMDTLSAAATYTGCRLTVRQGLLVFTLSTMKTVNDHGGFDFPWWISPINCIFPNTIDYHDIHHQPQGFRYNFSQPYFMHWDEVLGTRMKPDQVAKLEALNRQEKWKSLLPDKTTKTTAPTADASTAKDQGVDATVPTAANFKTSNSVTSSSQTPSESSGSDRGPSTASTFSTPGTSPVKQGKDILSGGTRTLILTSASVKQRRHRSLPSSATVTLRAHLDSGAIESVEDYKVVYSSATDVPANLMSYSKT